VWYTHLCENSIKTLIF